MADLDSVRTYNTVRERLKAALRTGDAYAVREEVIVLLADMGSGSVFAPTDEECAADTVRSAAPSSAPGVPLERPSGGA